MPDPTIVPAPSLRVLAACAISVPKSKVISSPASARPNGLSLRSTLSVRWSLPSFHQSPSASGVTNTGEKDDAGFDWKKPNPLANSPGIRLRRETSLVSPTSRTAASASSRLAPCATSPVTTTTSASRSQPQASSASGIGSRAPRKPSEPPWYISGSCQNVSGISAPRAWRTSATWFTYAEPSAHWYARGSGAAASRS